MKQQPLLWSKAHAEAGQVSIGEREQDHEEDVPGVMRKHHGEVVPRLDVAQHEERDEDHPHAAQDRKPDAVLPRLDTHGTRLNFKTSNRLDLHRKRDGKVPVISL